MCQLCCSFLLTVKEKKKYTDTPEWDNSVRQIKMCPSVLILLHVCSSFSWGKHRLVCRSPEEALLHLGPFSGGELFPLLIASLCFSSNAPFKSAGNLTNEQRSEQRGCLYCTTHPVPSTSPCPAVVHLSSLTPCPYSKPARAPLKVKPVQHTPNTYLLMHVHVDM